MVHMLHMLHMVRCNARRIIAPPGMDGVVRWHATSELA